MAHLLLKLFAIVCFVVVLQGAPQGRSTPEQPPATPTPSPDKGRNVRAADHDHDHEHEHEHQHKHDHEHDHDHSKSDDDRVKSDRVARDTADLNARDGGSTSAKPPGQGHPALLAYDPKPQTSDLQRGTRATLEEKAVAPSTIAALAGGGLGSGSSAAAGARKPTDKEDDVHENPVGDNEAEKKSNRAARDAEKQREESGGTTPAQRGRSTTPDPKTIWGPDGQIRTARDTDQKDNGAATPPALHHNQQAPPLGEPKLEADYNRHARHVEPSSTTEPDNEKTDNGEHN